MVTDCGSNLGGSWFLFLFCCTILVWVPVVSSFIFGVIWTWKISASFLSALIFYVPKDANGTAGTGFSSELINYVAAWVAALAEEIPGIVVFSGNNSTVSAMRSHVLL